MTTYFLMYLVITLGLGVDKYEYTTCLEIRGAPKTYITHTLTKSGNGKWNYKTDDKDDKGIEFELVGTVFRVKEGDKIVNVDISEELDASSKEKVLKLGTRKKEGGPEGTIREVLKLQNKAVPEIKIQLIVSDYYRDIESHLGDSHKSGDRTIDVSTVSPEFKSDVVIVVKSAPNQAVKSSP